MTLIAQQVLSLFGAVPLQDVLGHPNLRVFVTHCGVHSMWEAAFHGVPVVAVPFQFEQVKFGLCRGLHHKSQCEET